MSYNAIVYIFLEDALSIYKVSSVALSTDIPL